MYNFVFITGAGRCGTNVISGLIDEHSKIDVVANEYNNFFGMVLNANGFGSNVDLEHSGAYLLGSLLDIYKNDDDYPHIKSRLEIRFKEICKSGINHLSANVFLSHICEALFEKAEGTAVINVCDENIGGLLEAFPGCRIIHMIRNPLTQLNSRYLFRFGDVDCSFTGNYPGYWEFGKAFRKNFNSFRQASIFKNHYRVQILRMEDLQNNTREIVNRVFAFLGEDPESVNYSPSRRGQTFLGTRYGRNLSTDKVFADNEDWSCLSPNDLYVCGKIKDAHRFYDLPEFTYAKNSYFYFLRRQLGFIGNKRTRTNNPVRIFKVVVVSIGQYLQDLCEKHYFEKYMQSLENNMDSIFRSPSSLDTDK